MEEWICSCGQKNTSKFCTRCGKTRSVVDLSKSNDNVWTCSCGNKNTGAFCTQCGQKRIPVSSNDIDKKINPPTDSTPTTQPLKQNPPQLSEYPTQIANKRHYVIIGLLVVIIGLVGVITYLILKEKSEEVVVNPPAESTKERQEERVTETSVSAPIPEVKTNISDLSLGNICIGFSKERVFELIGLESQITDPEFSGHLRYQYPDMEVIITHNVVTAFVSKTAKVNTARGIHQGSSFQDMINAYGKNYNSFYYDGSVLYEYPFTSTDGKSCLLRFAIKNDIVDYISGRAVDIVAVDVYDGARETFREYYRFITEKKYDNAYDILSAKQKERRGTFDKFVTSYTNTISNEVENIGVRSIDANNISIEYTLSTRDKLNNGRVKVQRFKGEAILVYRDSRWLIDYAKSSKISEHIE